MIIVSACLLGENCKYSGGNNLKEEVVEYLKDKDYVAVCPERVFGAPRKPVEIKDGRVVRADGIDVDKEYRKAAEEEFDKIKDMNIELGVLKAKSPTCGVTRIYDGTFSGKLVEGSGIFAEKLKKLGVPLVEK